MCALGLGDIRTRALRAGDALVDTGASYTVLPSRLLRGLGIVPHTSARFVLADGREIECDLGRAWIRVNDQEEFTLVVFGEEALLGAVTVWRSSAWLQILSRSACCRCPPD